MKPRDRREDAASSPRLEAACAVPHIQTSTNGVGYPRLACDCVGASRANPVDIARESPD